MLEKKIIFTPHARYQLQERGFSEKEILAALTNIDRLAIQADGRHRAICSTVQNKKRYVWVIVYEEHATARKIITVFLTSKVKKYLML